MHRREVNMKTVRELIKKLSEFPAEAMMIVVVDGAPRAANITEVREFGAPTGEHGGFPDITVIAATTEQ
jgi:hypothetical protein